MWDKRWQLRDVDCRGLALKPLGVRVGIDRKCESWKAGARTIAPKGRLDVASANDASPNCGVTRQSFEGIQSAWRILDQWAKALHGALTELVNGALGVQNLSTGQNRMQVLPGDGALTSGCRYAA